MNTGFPVESNQEILDDIDYCIKRLCENKKIEKIKTIIREAKEAMKNIDTLSSFKTPSLKVPINNYFDEYVFTPDKSNNFLHGGPAKKHHRKRNKR